MTKFCSYCFDKSGHKIRISKIDDKCWNCGRNEKGNYFGITQFWDDGQ